MRCRRLCEKKPTGKYNIDAATAEQYKEGGQTREVLEMALLECLAKYGLDRSVYKKSRWDIRRIYISTCIYIYIYPLV